MSAGVVNTQQPGRGGAYASGPSYPEPTQPPGPNGTLPPGGPEPEYTPWFPAELGGIFDKYAGQALTPDILMQLAQDLMAANVAIQAQEADYKNNYLLYLQDQLGLNQQQISLAQKQLDFQQGPYWDWYTTQYFPAQQEMANNQLLMSQEQTEQARQSTQQSKSYALAGYYQSLIPQYELAIRMAENPQGVYAMGDARSNLARGQRELADRGISPPASLGY